MKKPSQIIFYFILTLLAVSLSACSPFSDSNYATTAELSESNLIEIPSFTADVSTITKGESVILDWTVNDEDPTYDIDYITITPNVGNVAESGSKQVTPTASITYTLGVYVKATISGEAITGELARARMLQITVLDAAGVEIEEEPEAEVCDDGEDNDRDILTDCDDDECAEDSACADIEVTYGFTSYSVSPDAPVIGDEVTLSWESNCELVTSDGFSGTKSGTDSYTFTIESETKTIALYCYVEGGLKGSETILVTATEPVIPDEPEFNARVSFKATPTTELIYGMPFCIEWSVEGATKVTLEGPNLEIYTVGSSEEACWNDGATGDNQGTYYLKVVDEQGLDNGSGKTLSITVNQFSSGSSSGMSDIIGRVPTSTDGEYYFISASKIYHTTDYGQNIETKSTSGWSGDISTLAVDTSGNLYLGTSKGVYLSTDTDKSSFTKILDADGESINAIYAKDTKNILVGTDEILVKVHPESEGCLDSTGTISTQVLNGYCFVAHDFNQRSEFEDYVNGGELHVYKFIPKADSSSKVVMITSDDSGTFYSEDSGENFELLNDVKITNGVWLDSDQGYFWYNKNDHEDYVTEKHSIWYYDDGEFISLGQDSSIENIQDVTEINGKTFIATENGVFYEYNDEWLVSDLESSVSYLMPYKSGLYSILGFASDGTEYQLSWDMSMLLRSEIILPELNLFD